MWRRKSERKRGVQLRMKERKCSQDDGEEVRAWSDPDKEEEGGGCCMGRG